MQHVCSWLCCLPWGRLVVWVQGVGTGTGMGPSPCVRVRVRVRGHEYGYGYGYGSSMCPSHGYGYGYGYGSCFCQSHGKEYPEYLCGYQYKTNLKDMYRCLTSAILFGYGGNTLFHLAAWNYQRLKVTWFVKGFSFGSLILSSVKQIFIQIVLFVSFFVHNLGGRDSLKMSEREMWPCDPPFF